MFGPQTGARAGSRIGENSQARPVVMGPGTGAGVGAGAGSREPESEPATDLAGPPWSVWITVNSHHLNRNRNRNRTLGRPVVPLCNATAGAGVGSGNEGVISIGGAHDKRR